MIELLLTFHCYKGSSSSSCESVGDIIERCAPCEEREVRRRRRRRFFLSPIVSLRLPFIIYNNISSAIILTHTYKRSTQKIDYCEPTGFKQLVKCYNDGEEESTAWIPCEEPEGEDAGLHAFLGFEVVAIVVALVSGYYVWKTRRRHRAKKQSHLYSIIGTPSRK